MSESKTTCRWQDDGEGNYQTECGNDFTCLAGSPNDNRMNFCCYCGNELKEEVFNGAC